jgi:hypothetical protein
MDRAQILAAQKNEAGRLFGFTSIPQPGAPTRLYQSMDIAYARRLAKYWNEDSSKVFRAAGNVFSTAHGQKYLRDSMQLGLLVMKLDKTVQRGTRLDDDTARLVWDRVTPVALAGFAISTTPSTWELAVESVAETIEENITRPFTTGLQTALKWGAIALVVAVLASKE